MVNSDNSGNYLFDCIFFILLLILPGIVLKTGRFGIIMKNAVGMIVWRGMKSTAVFTWMRNTENYSWLVQIKRQIVTEKN